MQRGTDQSTISNQYQIIVKGSSVNTNIDYNLKKYIQIIFINIDELTLPRFSFKGDQKNKVSLKANRQTVQN